MWYILFTYGQIKTLLDKNRLAYAKKKIIAEETNAVQMNGT